MLAAGAPPAYPVVPDVEPVARQYARAMAQHQFRRRLAGQGAAAAIRLIITGIPTPPPPLPPADLDVIAGLEGEGPELVAAAVARLGVPDPDEAELVNAVTEATGLDPTEGPGVVCTYRTIDGPSAEIEAMQAELQALVGAAGGTFTQN